MKPALKFQGTGRRRCLTYATGIDSRRVKSDHILATKTGDNMKRRLSVLAIVVCFVGLSASFAQSPQMGTWKLNDAKSKIPAGMMKNTTVVYSMEGDSVKVTTDGTSGDGSPLHTEWTGKFDGKDYPLTGEPSADTRSYKKVDDHTLTLENKKGGVVTTSGRIVVSADGKTRTLTASGKTSAGKKVTGKSVYDKQ